MKMKCNQLMRLGEIIRVLIFLLWIFYVRYRGKKNDEKKAVALRLSFEKLGSVFIKFGQMLALRPDYLSDTYCNELYKLLDQVPAFSKEQVMEVIQQELKSNTDELFIDFNFIPVASASFAQVHKAKLENGDLVAVKIQRPHIKRNVNSDIALLKMIAWVGDFIFRPANKFVTIINEFELWTKDELQYEIEAKNIETFNYFESLINNGIRGPKVYRKYSSSKILTMEFIEGYSLAQIIQAVREKNLDIQKKLTAWKFKGDEIVNKLMRNSLEMSHIHGFFHADPHPANIIYNKNKELIYIDFGIVGVLSKPERILVLRYLRSMLTGNSNDAFEALLALCVEYQTSNLEKVRVGYEIVSKRLKETFDSKTYLEQQKKSGPILIEALHLFQKNNFKVSMSLVRYFKAFETIEGLIFSLHPQLQVKNMAKEFRRVSILSIIDSLPNALEEKGIDGIVLKVITAIEDGFLLKK